MGDLAHDTDPVAVPDDATVADVREASRASGHLRIVVGDPAAPTGPAGVVHVRDTLLADPDRASTPSTGCVRPVHEATQPPPLSSTPSRRCGWRTPSWPSSAASTAPASSRSPTCWAALLARGGPGNRLRRGAGAIAQ